LIRNYKSLLKVYSRGVSQKENIDKCVVLNHDKYGFNSSLPQAIGIALEARRLDVIASIYNETKDISLLSYSMEGVLDTGFSLSYRDQVLRFLLPLFPQPAAGDGAAHVNSLTRLLVTLSDPSLTIPLFDSLVEDETLLAYQFAFDLVEGGSQDFLETLRTDLPEGDEVLHLRLVVKCGSSLIEFV